MHPELIKAQIRMTGITPTALARELGVTHTCVAHVIAGRGISARVSQRISEVIGVPVNVIWPARAQPPMRGRPRKDRSFSA